MVVALAVKEDRGAFLVHSRIAVKTDRHSIFILVIVDQVLAPDRPCAFNPGVIGAVFTGPVGVARDLAVLKRGSRIICRSEAVQNGERADRCRTVSLMPVVVKTIAAIAAVYG